MSLGHRARWWRGSRDKGRKGTRMRGPAEDRAPEASGAHRMEEGSWGRERVKAGGGQSEGWQFHS